MKLKIILAGLLCTIIAPPALAVTKCVALSSSGTTCIYGDTGTNVADWTATCKKNGIRTPIKGIGICSANKGSAVGATATELEISSTADDNLNCWCKMTSPAVSRWVFHHSGTSAGYCARNCAGLCSSNVQLSAAIRSALFGSLSD